jgi:hypothetical protein
VNREIPFFLRCELAALLALTFLGAVARAQVTPTTVVKLGYEIELRSDSKIFADEMNSAGRIIPLDEPTTSIALPAVPQIHFRGTNVQANDALLDNIQTFPGFRPFVHSTQSETSVATFGRTIVATYNSSAGIHLIPNPNGPGVVFDRIQLSGFSTSTDGGQTFTSGFFPGVGGIPVSFGDPSVDVDRHGNFFFAQLGEDLNSNGAVTVNSSSDGLHWNNAVVAAIDDGSDKEWLAVGPDPSNKSRDNVYVTWTSFPSPSFPSPGLKLGFAKSTDGGVTWTSRIIYAPSADPDPTHPQNALQSSNPVVDRTTGRLYVPFLHFSNSDTDFIQMLISDDGGATFRFATFNIPEAPDATLLPIVQPGELTECGATRVSPTRFAVNLRLTLHAGTDVGGSLTGLRRFVNATRLLAQPAIAARNGVVYLAWNTSTSPFFGDPNGTSNIMFMRSDDGGSTWSAAVQVNPPGDPHHTHPSLSIGDDPQSVHVSYYTQHADSTLDLDMANSHDRGGSFPADRTVRVSSMPFALPPTNIPIPTASNPFGTTNYDRNIAQCYALGEYQSNRSQNGKVYVLWGDTRNTIMQPVNPLDPISGLTHAKEDVFFQIVKAQ